METLKDKILSEYYFYTLDQLRLYGSNIIPFLDSYEDDNGYFFIFCMKFAKQFPRKLKHTHRSLTSILGQLFTNFKIYRFTDKKYYPFVKIGSITPTATTTTKITTTTQKNQTSSIVADDYGGDDDDSRGANLDFSDYGGDQEIAIRQLSNNRGLNTIFPENLDSFSVDIGPAYASINEEPRNLILQKSVEKLELIENEAKDKVVPRYCPGFGSQQIINFLLYNYGVYFSYKGVFQGIYDVTLKSYFCCPSYKFPLGKQQKQCLRCGNASKLASSLEYAHRIREL